jgi:hypothetical protein
MPTRLSPLILICLALALSCSQEPGPPLVWLPFPDHPGYTREEQISYLQQYPPSFGRPGDIVGEVNRIAEDHLDYLVHLAEDRLGYKDLAGMSGEELILVSAHLTQTIFHPCGYDRAICVPAHMSLITNNIHLDLYRDYGNEQNAFCVNYTMMHMGIFNGFKERFEALQRYGFIPVTITQIHHAIQGVYDRETDTIALMCGMEDDKDGKFNSGKYTLPWTHDQPELFRPEYMDLVRILSRMYTAPRETIVALESMIRQTDYPESHLKLYLAFTYGSLGEKDKAKALLIEVAKTNPMLGGSVYRSMVR